MTSEDPLSIAVAALSTRNWRSFEDLETATGLSRDRLIELKPKIEAELRLADPDLRVTSRMDLAPAGFEVG
jgi:hypothetical protein